MSLTPSAHYHLTMDLETIGRWSDQLPIDTTRHANVTQSTIHLPRDSTPPCDMEALEHSRRITLAEAVIASTCEYWLWDQPGTTLPPRLETADNKTLETTAARCVILAHNAPILATHPNIDQISYTIARASVSIQWARDNNRFHDQEDTDQAEPVVVLHNTTRAHPNRDNHLRYALFAADYDADYPKGWSKQICPDCHLTLPSSGRCDCG